MRATGHGLPGGYEGGLLVTTGRMDGLTVDAEARTVRMQAGCAGGRWSRRSRCRPGPPSGGRSTSSSGRATGARACTTPIRERGSPGSRRRTTRASLFRRNYGV
ncbi:hypothetical protein ABZX95_07570 [Streptomyces sp. NPDC004232]|uniref:hypothetical protein n=1 Tax=Streptomyces sp. NPDC004232 TaxID=3154454 RepID=UPI0033AC18F6